MRFSFNVEAVENGFVLDLRGTGSKKFVFSQFDDLAKFAFAKYNEFLAAEATRVIAETTRITEKMAKDKDKL